MGSRGGTYSVDSLKVRIPITRVKILDESIREMVFKVSGSTGDILEEKANTKASRDADGIKTTFSIEQRATQYDTIQYLVILVNAKQLKEQYFDGILIGNIADLHRYLISLGVVQFSLKELLKGECTDIDFKKDFEATDEDVKEAFDLMQKNSTPSADYDKGNKLFWKRDNKGLQFNKRETTKIKDGSLLQNLFQDSRPLAQIQHIRFGSLQRNPSESLEDGVHDKEQETSRIVWTWEHSLGHSKPL